MPAPLAASTDRPRFVGTGTVIAVVATTLPGLFQAVAFVPDQTVPLVALTALALGAATFGVAWAERRPGVGALSAVLGLYGLTVCTLLWLSRGAAFLTVMPLASMVVLHLPLRVALAVEAALVLQLGALVVRATADPAQRVTGVVGLASSIVFVFVFSRLARSERYARRDVERLSRQVEELATIRERTRIAREMHDTLGHCLTVASVQVEAARMSLDGREARLVRVQHLLRDGLTELRSAVSVLREGAEGTRPFAEALDGLVAECNATGLPAGLTTHGEVRALPPVVGFTLYRAAQEALTNVRRHAQASKVDVQLHYSPAHVRLRVLDDGVGGTPRNGHGLNGLKERLAQIGGTLAIDAPRGGGLALAVEVPA